MKQLSRNKMAMLGLIILLIEIVLAVLAPVIAPYDYTQMDIMSMFAPPSKIIVLSPPDTIIMAIPLVPKLSIPDTFTPEFFRLSIICTPKASFPTAPINDTSLPSFAAATAWFAPLPPGTVLNPLP